MILITGGAGYIGSHAAKAASLQGHDVLVLDNLSYGHREFAKWGSFEEADLADLPRLHQIFAQYPIKAVMHFAGFAYVGESVTNPAKYYANNVTNTLNLLEAMRKACVNKFIFSSTCATYGIPDQIPITEDHPQHPINPYGKSKLMVEQVLQDYSSAYNLRYVALRYFNAAGADPDGDMGEWHNPETHLIPLVLDAASGKRPNIEIYGTDYPTPDGTCIRDYIHVTDLADAHLNALDYLLKGGNSVALNLGNGCGFSVKEVIATIEKITGRNVPFKAAARRAGDPPILIGSGAKAKAVLGWSPQYGSLDEIIATAWKWHSRLND